MRKIITIILVFTALAVYQNVHAEETSCQACHAKLNGRLSEPVTQWKNSVHHQAGISCTNCHGGDPAARSESSAHNEKTGWIGKPGPIKSVRICGNCHGNELFMKKFDPNARTDQLKNYLTSNHGINIMFKKDGKGATCVSCHGAHDVLKAMNPQSHVYPTRVVETCAKCHADKKLMAKYGISGNEVSEYKKSVHAKALYEGHDLFAPTCNDCHGNHGAVPPKAASIEDVCGLCHALDQKLFNESPHKAWKESGLRGCMECHGNHAILKPTDAMLAPGKGICLKCHETGEKALKTMNTMYSTLTGLKRKMENTKKLVDTASEKGMPMDDALLILQEARNSYIKSHTAIHKFNAAYVQQTAQGAFKEVIKAQKIAHARIAEIKKRRAFFYWFGAVIILLILLLSIKIRIMVKKKKRLP